MKLFIPRFLSTLRPNKKKERERTTKIIILSLLRKKEFDKLVEFEFLINMVHEYSFFYFGSKRSRVIFIKSYANE